jgi:hypothetical protein
MVQDIASVYKVVNLVNHPQKSNGSPEIWDRTGRLEKIPRAQRGESRRLNEPGQSHRIYSARFVVWRQRSEILGKLPV